MALRTYAAVAAILVYHAASAQNSTTTSSAAVSTITSFAANSSAPGFGCGSLAACNSTYTVNSTTWTLTCDHDLTCDNIGYASVNSFQACFAACNAFSGSGSSCSAFTYSGTSCWLKSGACTPVLNGNVDSAYISSPAPATYPTCPASNGTQYNTGGEIFLIECFDRIGGDFQLTYTDTFEGCMATCAATSGCVDVSYEHGDPGPCYMKNKTVPASASSLVWGARLLGAFCPAQNGSTVQDSNGAYYTVHCASDSTVGSYTEVSAPTSVLDCMTACDSQYSAYGCTAFVYDVSLPINKSPAKVSHMLTSEL